MTSANVELVIRIFTPDGTVGSEIEMTGLFTDSARLAELIADDAPIEFATPDGGFVGDMAGPFRGAAGLEAGWGEWLAPWDSFAYQPTEWTDLGDGRVLTLGNGAARLRSGVEVDAGVGALFTVRDGQVVRIQHFLDQEQARRAAGRQ